MNELNLKSHKVFLYDYEIEDNVEVVFLGSEVHFEGGSLCYNGPNILKVYGGDCVAETDESGNTSNIESTGIHYGDEGTNIVAGDYQIFKCSKGVELCGTWNIKGTVYASWFGMEDTSSLIKPENIEKGIDGRKDNNNENDIDLIDNSIAINTAIKLKGMGEVRLPQGIYCIKNHIRVTSGIQLIGVGPDIEGATRGTVLYPYYDYFSEPQGDYKSSYQLAISKVDSESRLKLSEIPFPLHTEPYNHISAEMAGIETGYMIVVNICDKIKVETIKNDDSEVTDIIYFHNVIECPTRPRVTRISGIDLVYWESIYKFIREGQNEVIPLPHHYKGILFAGKIEIDNVRSFGLTQLCSSTYIDYSDNRYIHDNSFSLGENYDYALDFPKPIYAFDLSGLGDALRFCGNHVATYHNKIGALRIDQCKGGVIQGNILNSDVMINRCQGITYNGNHSEYGIKLDIRGSSVSVCDNVFWKGSHPTIRIRRIEFPKSDYLQCVTLQNNTFVNFMKVNILQSHNISELCEYDVVPDGWANIVITNCYRTRFYEDVNEYEPTGIKMGLLTVIEETQTSEPYYYDTNVTSDFHEFNEFSHIYSIQSVVSGKKVTTGINRSAFIENDILEGINIYEIEVDDTKYKNCYERNGSQIRYTIIEIYDESRHLGRTLVGDREISFEKNKSMVNIALNTLPSSNVKKIAMLRIERCVDGLYSYVNVPICGATLLMDDCEAVNGYKWSEGNRQKMIDVETVVSDIIYKGDNIECTLEKLPNLEELPRLGESYCHGEWKSGDVVWCGNLLSLQCYVMHGGVWRKIYES